MRTQTYLRKSLRLINSHLKLTRPAKSLTRCMIQPQSHLTSAALLKMTTYGTILTPTRTKCYNIWIMLALTIWATTQAKTSIKATKETWATYITLTIETAYILVLISSFQGRKETPTLDLLPSTTAYAWTQTSSPSEQQPAVGHHIWIKHKVALAGGIQQLTNVTIPQQTQ